MSREPRTPTADQLLEHTAFLGRLARQVVGDEHRAEDVVQDAYALALARPPREARSLRGWLAVVVANLARNERRGAERRAARERVRSREERVESGELALETLEVQRRLIEFVVALAEELRTVLYLRYYEGLPPSAIAQRLGVPVKTIKARQTRALGELRARLDAETQGDRRAWLSALLPVTGLGHSATARTSSTSFPPGARLAVGAAAVLVAVVAWSARRQTGPEPREVASVAITAPEPAPALGNATLGNLVVVQAPAMEAAAVAREEIAPAAARPLAEPAVDDEEFTLVLEVDRARVRELGWVSEGASNEQVDETVTTLVRRRLRSMGCDVRLQVAAESGRIEVARSAPAPRERELLEHCLRDLGLCEFLVVAEEASLAGLEMEIDLAAEQQRLEAWRGAHPDLPLADFNALDMANGGPHPRLAWVRSRFGDADGALVPMLLPDRLEDHLGASSFARVFPTEDSFGYPCLGFDVLPSRWNDLTWITAARVGQRLAVVIGDELRTAPTLDWRWTGGGSIEGRFGTEELVSLAESLPKLEGPLRIVESR